MRSLALGCTSTAKICWMELADVNGPFLYQQALGFCLLPPRAPSPDLPSPTGFSRAAVDGAVNHFCHHCFTKVQRERTLLK